jgi:hypothetical protein
MSVSSRFLMVTALTLLALGSAAAREEIPSETRYLPFSGQVSACDAPGILATIQSRFAQTERRDWNSDAEIVTFEWIRQAGLRPSGLDLIPRRYCEAVAVLSNKRRHIVRYAITEGYAIAGHGEGVHFCVAGYDRNLTSGGGQCRRFDR